MWEGTALLRIGIAATLACCALVSAGAVAKSPNRSKHQCAPWFGTYDGTLSEDQNFFGQAEKVSVFVDAQGVTVQIWGEDGGSFLASSINFNCTGTHLQTILDTGAEGAGKISFSMRRDRAIHMRLWNYNQGIGPNKAGYLPPDKLEIPVKRTAQAAPADPRDRHIERIMSATSARYETAVLEAGGKTHRCRVMTNEMRCAFFAGPRGSFTIFSDRGDIVELNVVSTGKAQVIIHGAHDSDVGLYVRSRHNRACWNETKRNGWSPICVW